MTRKVWLLILLVLGLGSVSLYLNRDWFGSDTVQIHHRSRPARALFPRRKRPDNSGINPIVFSFDRKLKLTSLKVVTVSDITTNKYPHAIWHVVSVSNSVPIKTFTYGMVIQGMRPEVKGLEPEPLEPGVKYRLLVEAGSFKAEHDFIPEPRTP